MATIQAAPATATTAAGSMSTTDDNNGSSSSCSNAPSSSTGEAEAAAAAASSSQAPQEMLNAQSVSKHNMTTVSTSQSSDSNDTTNNTSNNNNNSDNSSKKKKKKKKKNNDDDDNDNNNEDPPIPISPMSPPGQIMMNIVDPQNTDVLCGRGGAALRHPGNQTYRRLVNLNKGLYTTCLKAEKLKISKSIVAAIRELRGRFLERNANNNTWYDIGDKKAMEKTSQALREGQPKLRQRIVEMGGTGTTTGTTGGTEATGGIGGTGTTTGTGTAFLDASATAAAAAASPMMTAHHSTTAISAMQMNTCTLPGTIFEDHNHDGGDNPAETQEESRRKRTQLQIQQTFNESFSSICTQMQSNLGRGSNNNNNNNNNNTNNANTDDDDPFEPRSLLGDLGAPGEICESPDPFFPQDPLPIISSSNNDPNNYNSNNNANSNSNSNHDTAMPPPEFSMSKLSLASSGGESITSSVDMMMFGSQKSMGRSRIGGGGGGGGGTTTRPSMSGMRAQSQMEFGSVAKDSLWSTDFNTNFSGFGTPSSNYFGSSQRSFFGSSQRNLGGGGGGGGFTMTASAATNQSRRSLIMHDAAAVALAAEKAVSRNAGFPLSLNNSNNGINGGRSGGSGSGSGGKNSNSSSKRFTVDPRKMFARQKLYRQAASSTNVMQGSGRHQNQNQQQQSQQQQNQQGSSSRGMIGREDSMNLHFMVESSPSVLSNLSQDMLFDSSRRYNSNQNIHNSNSGRNMNNSGRNMTSSGRNISSSGRNISNSGRNISNSGRNINVGGGIISASFSGMAAADSVFESRQSLMSGWSKISDSNDTGTQMSIFSDLSRKIGNVSTRSIAMSEISSVEDVAVSISASASASASQRQLGDGGSTNTTDNEEDSSVLSLGNNSLLRGIGVSPTSNSAIQQQPHNDENRHVVVGYQLHP